MLLDTSLSRALGISKNGDFSGQPILVFSYSTLKKGFACLNEISCILNLSSLTLTFFSRTNVFSFDLANMNLPNLLNISRSQDKCLFSCAQEIPVKFEYMGII